MYGILTTTKFDHMTGQVETGAQPGPKPYLTAEEEEFPHTSCQYWVSTHQESVSCPGSTNCGWQRTVSNGWQEWYVHRHPDLA